MKNILLLAFFMLVFFLPASYAQNNKKEDNLKAYYLVLLRKGPHRDQDSATAAIIQKEHLANINRLASEGKINVAGPFLDEGDLKGIFVFDVTSEEEVKALVESDPAVKAGRLLYEIHPWMTQKGTCFK